jgi:hypothetical protein
MKYKTYAKSVLKTHKGIFRHQMVTDNVGNTVPVMVIPERLVAPVIMNFLIQKPRGDIGEWFGYVLYICIPDATEMSELYEAEYGKEACSEWIGDLYTHILLINPALDYEMVEAFQEPVKDDKVVQMNSRQRRKGQAHLW